MQLKAGWRSMLDQASPSGQCWVDDHTRVGRIPRPLGTLIFLLAWLTQWRPAFRIRPKQSTLSFFAHHRDVAGRHIAKYGVFEPILTRWIAEYLSVSPSGVFIDVGANLGWHAVHAAQYKSVKTVVAFEPDVFNAWLLDRNLALNGIRNAIVNVCAVGARRGSVRLNLYKCSNFGRHSVVFDHGYGSRTVPMIDLDTALSDLGLSDQRVLILKIDVEGYEPAVIAGAKQTLQRTDVVITEYSPGSILAGSPSPHDMCEQLRAAGFTPHRFAKNGRVGEIAMDELRVAKGQADVVWIRASGRERELGEVIADRRKLSPLCGA